LDYKRRLNYTDSHQHQANKTQILKTQKIIKMSTRGTYKIDGMLLYNHHDNYPSGTAYHLIETIKTHKNLHLFSVIRSMTRAEKITHTNYGQDYHYDITENEIICYKYDIDDNKNLHSSDTIENWINKNIVKQLDETDDPNDYFVIKINNNYFDTKNNIFTEAKNHFENAIKMSDAKHIGNGSSEFKTAFDLFKLSTLDYSEYKEKYISQYVPLFVESYKHKSDTLFLSYCN
jgi:hypothetical protein